MAGRGESIYDPTGAWSELNAASEKPDGGIGQNPEKNPTATLRIFGSNLGNQWLMYGGITGGTQDYVAPPHAGNTPAKCGWFRFHYTGVLEIGGEAVFGNWKVTVEGSGLEMVAYQIGKHIKPTLMVGERQTGLHAISVTAIKIEVAKVKRQAGLDDEEEWQP